MPATQRHRPIQIITPLGEDVLLFHRMSGHERLSGLFEYELELLSEKPSINADDLLGHSVTISIDLPDDKKRYFNGFVTRFGHYGYVDDFMVYRATIRPWLWFLSRATDCRIFQDKDVTEIIKKVFADQGFSGNYDSQLSKSYPKRLYCVQYRETDFNFVSRLLEEEGIYYYFKHDNGKHQLVLCDGPAREAFPGYASMPFFQSQANREAQMDRIQHWGFASEVRTGNFALTDYDEEKPRSRLLAVANQPASHPHAGYQSFDYPGLYKDVSRGEDRVRLRCEEQQVLHQQFEGSGNARGLAVGYKFTLADHPLKAQNQEYIVVSASHHLESDAYTRQQANSEPLFETSFTAIRNALTYRPSRQTAKPFVHGTQTAVVTGPSGEEIYTDQHGRVKVHFHWDRKDRWEAGRDDPKSSCWIRVAHPWAGKNWGMVAIPRIGHEVVVDFLEGDPDQPIIVGSVYNGENMPPYALPGNATQTGILTRSSKGGSSATANQLRFEDKMGSEQVYLHAEKNQDIEVENDETHWVGHDRSKTIDHDETTHVKHDRTETVDHNETITIGVNRTESVGSNETITIGLNRTRAVGVNEAIAIGAAQEIAVGAARTVSVGANQATSIGNNHSVAVGNDQSSSIGDNRSAMVGKDDKLTVGKNLVIEAGDSVTIKTGQASITMKKDGTITISGKDITIKGSGEINAKASKDVVIKGKNVLQN